MSERVVMYFESEGAYLDWIARNQNGFVLNVRAKHDPEYVVLHRATCYSIAAPASNAPEGGFTERGYRKVCSTSLDSLRDWAQSYGRDDGSFSSECSFCIGKGEG